MGQNVFKPSAGVKDRWKDAMSELAWVMKKENPEGVQELVKKSARRFVKNISDVTPPATGKADGSAKKRGEAAILGDLLKLAVPTTVAGSARAAREVLATAEDLMEAHARAVQGGRVNPRNRKNKLFVAQATFNQVLKKLQNRVGWLAAALNAAATKLGVSLPAWIKRHGNKYGMIEVRTSKNGISIRIVQNVPYADDVKGYERRWEFALVKEIKGIWAQAKIIWGNQEAKARARLRH